MEYKKFKNAAAVLHNRFWSPRVACIRVRSAPTPLPRPHARLPEGWVSLDALAYQAPAALARREVFLLESEHIAAKPIPVEVHVRAIHQRIRTAKHLRFLAAGGPAHAGGCGGENVLAILELYKRHGEARAGRAVRRYRDRLHRGFGRLVFTGDDALTSVGEE